MFSFQKRSCLPVTPVQYDPTAAVWTLAEDPALTPNDTAAVVE